MGAAASSCSFSALPSKNYDVFISFRGEDTRTNFTSHLHTALCQKGIKTYIDYELPKGDDISQSLMQAIEGSSISVVVFSENYASSKWCLNELVKIMECKRDQQQIVIPVFYKVDPSDVRKQTGTYKKAFLKHETDFIHDQDKVNNWKRALSEIANLAGWDSNSRIYRDESEFIGNIVNNILQKMKVGHPNALRGLVGIDENCDSIEQLLEEAPIIGIWGMGGIGKTTMARVVFAKLSSKFDSCCFLDNVREESERHGLSYIRDKLLLELLNEGNLSNMEFAMRRLGSKKVFIVLDDVNSSKQIEYFARDYNCLGQGSRIIITTRNKHLLTLMIGAPEIYEAKALSYDKSLQLFNLKAFRKDYCDIEYEELAERAVLYTKSNPLALITLGSFLHSKTTEEWDSALTRLEKNPIEDIQDVLKLSYDGLNYEEREIFLSIACFLKGEGKEHVISLFDSYGFCASIGLRSLVDKALITITGIVWMHDLLQKMGWEIVRQECIKEPGRRSRLWDPEEVHDVLKNNRGTSAIEGIILDLSEMRDVHLSADTFKHMTNLRFLKICSPWDKKACTIHLPSGLESFSDTLRYLQWDKFPMESLPPTFCAEKLVELRMRGSRIKKLWDGVQNCVNLRTIDLARCEQLMELPDFSKAHNLQFVELTSCKSLCHVHPSILSLQRLAVLELSNCSKLENLRCENHSQSLHSLDVRDCFNLKEFGVSSEVMIELHLEFTGIEILDSSIGRLSNLWSLYLNGSILKFLPINELCCLTSLRKLHLFNMGEIIDKSKLSMLFDSLHSLQEIFLTACSNLIELPNNIKHLSRLERLYLLDCKRLQSLPVLPPFIKEVVANNCTSLETLQGYFYELLWRLELIGSNVQSLPASIKHHSKLSDIDLTDCWRLQSLQQLPPSVGYVRATNCISLETALPLTTSRPRRKYLATSLLLENCMKLEQHSLSQITEYAYFSLKRAVYVHDIVLMSFGYPGSRVPKWFSYNQTTKASSSVTFELSVNNVVGFVFCSVVPQFTPLQNCPTFLRCQCCFEDGEEVHYWNGGVVEIKELTSDHVFQWYDLFYSSKILTTLLSREEEQGINYSQKLSFEFSVVSYDEKIENIIKTHDDLIEACGVCPIYASDYHNFLQQVELELELGIKTNRGRPIIDEHSLCGIMEYATSSLKSFERTIMSYPKTKIPEWFTNKSSTTGDSIIVNLAPDFDCLLGFVFCFVIPQFSSKEMYRSHSTCLCYYKNHFELEGPRGWHYCMKELNSEKVFLWYDPLFCEAILGKLGQRDQNKEGSSNDPELSFEFKFGDCLIEECGVRSIYASEYSNFLQQIDLKLKLGTKT